MKEGCPVTGDVDRARGCDWPVISSPTRREGQMRLMCGYERCGYKGAHVDATGRGYDANTLDMRECEMNVISRYDKKADMRMIR